MHYRKGRFPFAQLPAPNVLPPPMAGAAYAMRTVRERRLAGPRRPGKAARGALAAGEPPVLPGPPAGGFPGVLPLAGRGKFALTRVKLRSTLSSNRGSWAITSRLSRERPAASVVIRCGHAAPRTGPQQRPGAATAGRPSVCFSMTQQIGSFS